MSIPLRAFLNQTRFVVDSEGTVTDVPRELAVTTLRHVEPRLTHQRIPHSEKIRIEFEPSTINFESFFA